MDSISDERLIAYADGELDDQAAQLVRAAIDADPQLAARLKQHRQLRQRISGAYQNVLAEPVPDRLLQAIRPAAAVPIDLAAHRAARLEHPAPTTAPPPPGWARWGGMAASLVIGMLIGALADFGRPTTNFATTPVGLVAAGAVADGLSNQLASAPPAEESVRVQVSFIDQTGRFCRTFTAPALAGLACRDSGRWLVQALFNQPAGSQPAMRQAGTQLPRELLQMIDERIRGDALDAAAEQAARQGNWQR